MIERIIPISIIAIVAITILIVFYRYYGIFNFPWLTYLPIMFLGCLTVFQNVVLLPYDTSTTLFGSTDVEHKALGVIYEVLYWIGMALSWVLMPVLTAIFIYNYALTPGRRVWYAIRHNLVFWAIVGGLAIVGVVILLATRALTLQNLIPLVMALNNTYGLIVMNILLGYGYIALPKTIWIRSNPTTILNKNIMQLNVELKSMARSIVDGETMLDACKRSEGALNHFKEREFRPLLNPRVAELREILESMVDFDKTLLSSQSPSKYAKKDLSIDWKDAFDSTLENFLADVDKSIKNLKESVAFKNDKVHDISLYLDKTLEYQKNTVLSRIKSLLLKGLAILLALLSALSFYGEFVLMINSKYSFFNFIFQKKIPTFVNILFITFPILGYMFFTAAWTLTKIRISSLFRFIPHGSNDDTFYFWTTIFTKCASTISYHFLLQIDGKNCQIYKVLGDMSRVAFLGTSWNKFSTIIMILIGLLAVFNIIEKIFDFFGIHTSLPLDKVTGNQDYLTGKHVYLKARPEDKVKMDSLDLAIMSNTSNSEISANLI